MKSTKKKASSATILLPALAAAVALGGACAREQKDGLSLRLPARLSALSVDDAAALAATLEIEGVLPETALTISADLSEATGSFVVDVPAARTAPFTLRLRYQPDEDTNVLLARLAGEIALTPNQDNVLSPTGDYDTCGATAAGGPCALSFDLNRNGTANLDDLIAGVDPLPPPPFVDVAPADLAFPSGIRLGSFSRQVIVVENSSARPVEVSATLIDAPGATLQPFETEPSSESGARRALDLGLLDPFEEVLVAVSFAPVNPFLTVGDVFIEARDPASNVRQATRVRVLANVDGELQPPPVGFTVPPLADAASLGGYDGRVETFSTTSLFNGLPVTSVQGADASIAGLPFSGKSITATFAEGDAVVTASVPADQAFLVEIPAEHKLAVTLSGLETDVDLAVLRLDEGDVVSTDPARNTRVSKAGTSAEAVELSNESGGVERALVVLGRVEVDAPPAVTGGLAVDEPAPFALSAHVTSAPEFTAPLDPAGGPLEGGTRVTLRGKRFHPNARVTFADAIGLDCTYREVDAETLFDCTAPPGSLIIGKNPATIVVANPQQDEGGDGQAATLPEGFTYEPPAPRLDALLPAVAPTTGSSAPIVVRGAFFSQRNGAPTVSFNGEAAPGVVFIDSTRLEVNAPPGNAGIVVVTVQNRLDPQPGDPPEFVRLSLPSNARNFTYVTPDNPAPTLASAAPATSSIDGGELITVTGSGFLAGASVLFGGDNATDVEVLGDDTLTCRSPARAAAGSVNIEVINVDGQRATLTGAFSYFVPSPSVAGAFPDSASVAGGTFIVIEGSGFRAGVKVELDNGTAVFTSPNVNRVSTSTLLAATPAVPSGGDYTLRVVNLDGQRAELGGSFRFLEPSGPPPRIDSLSPNAGNKDVPVVVTLTGAELRGSPPAVIAGTTAAEIVSASTDGAVDTISFVMPTSPSAGPVVVRVINDDGQSDTTIYNYFTQLGSPPVIDSVGPSLARKNDTLTVLGRSFDVVDNGAGGTILGPSARVLVGGQLVSPLTATATRLTLRVPDLDAVVGGSGATVAVEVTNGDGQSTSATFAYAVNVTAPPPAITSVTPGSVDVAGGTSVVLRGTGFQAGGALTVGGAAVAGPTVTSTSVTFTAPARAQPGTAIVRFQNPDGQSSSVALEFTATPPPPLGAPPRIDAVTPDTSPTAGGAQVTLSGAGFVATGKLFVAGALTAAQVTATTVTFTAPAHAAGLVVVRFENEPGVADDIIFRYGDDGGGGGGPTGAAIGFVDPDQLHAFVPGDIVTLVGRSLGVVQSVTIEDQAAAPIGNAVVVGGASDLSLDVQVTSALPDSRQTGPLRFRVTFGDGTSVISPPFVTTVPKATALFGGSGDPALIFGEDLNAAALAGAQLAGGGATLPLDVLARGETFLQTSPFPSQVPGVPHALELVYNDVVGGGTLAPVAAEGIDFGAPPLDLDPAIFDEPLPADQSPAGLAVIGVFFGGLEPAFGTPTTFAVLDGSGQEVASGTWQLTSGLGGGQQVSPVQLAFTSTSPVPAGEHQVLLRTSVSARLALSQPQPAGQSLRFAGRSVDALFPPTIQTGRHLGLAGNFFDGDTIVAEDVVGGTAVALGTVSAQGCDPLTRGCAFLGGGAVPDTLPIGPGSYRVCAVPAGAPPACPSSTAVLSVVDQLDTITDFTPQLCQVFEHEPLTGDDRGGFGVTSSHAYYTGDGSTGIFDLGTLGGAAAAFRHDGLFADPVSGTVYALADSVGTELVRGPGVFNLAQLLVLDPVTLDPTGTAVPLSQTIALDLTVEGHGVFAGDNVVVLYAQQVDGWFAIDLTTGLVDPLVVRPRPFMTACDSWASWGIVEKKGVNHVITYANAQANRLERLELETDIPSVAATFSFLGDMCTIGLVPSLGRWFFHYENTAQFGPRAEALGSCVALVCGDGVCGTEEKFASCAEDCPLVCGDGFCEGPVETPTSCGLDCSSGSPGGSFCGNGICEGEEPQICPSDCSGGGCNANGVCDAGESPSCPDCGGGFCNGNGVCDAGEDPGCPDCGGGFCNGNGVCDAGEDPGCPDCGGGFCNGNGVCDAGEDPGCPDCAGPPPGCTNNGLCDFGEQPGTCQDCPVAPAGCGNGTCDVDENDLNCAADCGSGSCNFDTICNGAETPATCPDCVPQCSDGIDNDGDGFTDFPGDPDCVDGNDPSESSAAGGPCNFNFVCDAGEDEFNCPNDCSPPPGSCNFNFVCEPGEDPGSCPNDCP